MDGNDYHESSENHRKGDKGDQYDGPSAGRKLSLYDPFLRLEVPIVAQEQNCDADTQEDGPEGLPQTAQRIRDARPIRERGIQSKELRDGNPDGRES